MINRVAQTQTRPAFLLTLWMQVNTIFIYFHAIFTLIFCITNCWMNEQMVHRGWQQRKLGVLQQKSKERTPTDSWQSGHLQPACPRQQDTHHHWATVHCAPGRLQKSTQHDLNHPQPLWTTISRACSDWWICYICGGEQRRGGFCCIKIEPEPVGAEDWGLMRGAIINYSKHLIMVSHDAVVQTHTCARRHNTDFLYCFLRQTHRQRGTEMDEQARKDTELDHSPGFTLHLCHCILIQWTSHNPGATYCTHVAANTSTRAFFNSFK